LVTVLEATRPKKGATGKSWPFQAYEQHDKQFLRRGWRRTSSRPIKGGADGKTTIGELRATVWRDNKFVTLLSTAFHCTTAVMVPRWVKEEKKRRFVLGFLALKMYQTYMGGVDRLDKTIARANIRMKHCAKRFQRALFFWLLSAVGFHNVTEQFKALFPGGPAALLLLQRRHDNGSVGFSTWLQLTMGKALISEGLRRAHQENGALAPHFMPKRSGPVPAAPISAVPASHKWLPAKLISIQRDENRHSTKQLGSNNHCKQCYFDKVPNPNFGGVKATLNGAEGFVMPVGHPRAGLRVKQTSFGCSGCKINLCSQACHDKWDHVNNIAGRGGVTVCCGVATTDGAAAATAAAAVAVVRD